MYDELNTGAASEVNVMVYLTTVSLKCDKVLVVLEDGSSTIEEGMSNHTQGEEVSGRVKSVGEGILWSQVVQRGLTDGLAVGDVFLKGPEGLTGKKGNNIVIICTMFMKIT